MLVVRYVALAALVVWLGTIVGEVFGRSPAVPYVCGALILTCLFILKFVGPPPPAFIPRVAIVVTMVVVALGSAAAVGLPDHAPAVINLALGLALLFWYAHES